MIAIAKTGGGYGRRRGETETTKFFQCKSGVCKYCFTSEPPDPVGRARIFFSDYDGNPNLKVSVGSKWFSNSVVHWNTSAQASPAEIVSIGQGETWCFWKFPQEILMFSQSWKSLMGVFLHPTRSAWMTGEDKKVQFSQLAGPTCKVKLPFERMFHLSVVSDMYSHFLCSLPGLRHCWVLQNSSYASLQVGTIIWNINFRVQ